jgi:hypothetical protein
VGDDLDTTMQTARSIAAGIARDHSPWTNCIRRDANGSHGCLNCA